MLDQITAFRSFILDLVSNVNVIELVMKVVDDFGRVLVLRTRWILLWNRWFVIRIGSLCLLRW